MDLRVYYQQIRAVESEIAEQDAIVMSLATRDGGKPGILSEVPRAVAAKLIVDGKARLASTDEESRYRSDAEEAGRRAAGVRAPLYETGRIQVAAIPEVKKTPTRRGS
ncbi:MAG: hypothetical protein ABI823_07610 [Bryobacteraceae bacterium]